MASFEEMKASLKKAMFDVRMKEKELSSDEIRAQLEAVKFELAMMRGLEIQANKIGIDLSKVEIDDLLQFSGLLSSFCERYDALKNNKGEGRK